MRRWQRRVAVAWRHLFGAAASTRLGPSRLALWRAGSLWAGMLLLLVVLWQPHARLPHRVYDWFFVVDITQSMNVPDYTWQGQSLSRLQAARLSIRQTLAELPCGSRVALGMFTERNTLNIVRPVEVCSHFAALDQTVAHMDWRMAWAADSFIAHGVFSALEQMPKLGKEMRLMFFTDGQQAPPANPRYMPRFAGTPGAIQGLLVGMGQTTPGRIPKLDDKGAVVGYWEQEEVQRYGNFGMAETLSVLAMEQGQHDRNAGHGAGSALLENAHLSALDAANLQRLATQTGLRYARLETPGQAGKWATGLGMSAYRWADTDLRPWLATLAAASWLLYLLLSFAYHPLWARLARRYQGLRQAWQAGAGKRFFNKEST